MSVGPALPERPALQVSDVYKRFGRLEVLRGVDLAVGPGRSWRWSARTAPASRRSCSASPGTYRPIAAPSRWPVGRSPPTPFGARDQRCGGRVAGPGAVRQPQRRRQPVPRQRARGVGSSTSRDGRRGGRRCSSRFTSPSPTRNSRWARSRVGSASWSPSPGRSCAGRPCWCSTSRPPSLGVNETRVVERLLAELRAAGTAVLLVSHRLDQVFRLVDRIAVLREGRIVAEVSPLEVHPDDVVAMMSGVEADPRRGASCSGCAASSTSWPRSSRRRASRSSCRPWPRRSGCEQLCVHLLDEPGRPARGLRRRPRSGLSPRCATVDCWRSATVAARPGSRPRRARPWWSRTRAAIRCGSPLRRTDVVRPAAPGRCRSSARGVLGHDLGLRRHRRAAPGRPARAGLALREPCRRRHRAGAAAGRRHPSQPHARDPPGRARHPGRPAAGRGAWRWRSSRCAGAWAPMPIALHTGDGAPLQTSRPVSSASSRPGGASSYSARPRRRCSARPGRVDRARPVGPHVLAVPIEAPDGRPWSRPGGPNTTRLSNDALDLLDDAARSLQPGPGARGARAGQRRGGVAAPLATPAAGVPLAPEPRAAHPAHRHPGVRLHVAPDRRELGRVVPAAVPRLDRLRVGPHGSAGRRPARLQRHRLGDAAPRCRTGATSGWCSRRRGRA